MRKAMRQSDFANEEERDAYRRKIARENRKKQRAQNTDEPLHKDANKWLAIKWR